jgi:hypothetical protein
MGLSSFSTSGARGLFRIVVVDDKLLRHFEVVLGAVLIISDNDATARVLRILNYSRLFLSVALGVLLAAEPVWLKATGALISIDSQDRTLGGSGFAPPLL